MDRIHVLAATRVTAEQLERLRAISARIVVHGEPGGIAIMDSSEVDYKGIDYPEERPDLNVAEMLANSEVIIATRIPVALRERAPKLRWIQFTSAGVDHLWKPFLDSGDITVTSAKGLHAIPMAEFVLGCMLAFAKGLPRMLQQQREHIWKKFVVDELYGHTVALIGVGEIGGGVARLSKLLGMHVIGVRRKAGTDGLSDDFDDVVPFERMTEALGRADYVVAALPNTAKTFQMIGQTTFRAMKDTAVFINVGRGKTVDEQALVRALSEQRIRGAALDVFESEPLPTDSPLWSLPNVIVSPHMGADTTLYMERMTDIICDNLKRYAEGRPLRNVVDPVERY
jgi:D-2-hydroxyacid dehydrogenase (NADP+)